MVTSEDYAGVIMGDLSSRRGRIEGMEHRAGSQVIKAIVPLAEMFVYATQMRSISQGRADYSMRFAHYEAAFVPASPGLTKQELPLTNPKAQQHGGASLPASWTQNPSDRKFSVVAPSYPWLT